jgi:RNA-directed DNA polymerase
MDKAKSYYISKHVVWEAYKRVKANRGAAGIDDVTIKEFEENLEDNLYKIWNRMSSGSYFPPAVKAVEIPKPDGKKRKLGIPTVSDRIAQMVVKIYLEPNIEPQFHENSYGYRPNKSGLEAVGVARKRCWKYDWVIDIDIKGFFDNLDHELMMRAVKKHTDEPWILLYVQRWLEAPIQETDGSIVKRTKGTPQGGVISPLLANLFLHYAFDQWMKKNFSQNPFERYADDIVVHCRTENEAVKLKEAIKARLLECKLELHPEKTKIVYCKDSNRRGNSQNEKFDFLGYTFRPRSSRSQFGKLFTSFSPAMSDKAQTKAKEVIKSWLKEVKPTDLLTDFAKIVNPIVTGWINYYGKYYASELWSTVKYIEMTIMKWGKKKYEKLKRYWKKVYEWLTGIKKRQPDLFKHWQWMQRRTIRTDEPYEARVSRTVL